MMRTLLLGSTALLLWPAGAYAQSTGTVDFEKEIVVTAARSRDIAGVEIPSTAKARSVLTQEVISRQIPGQSILDTINLVPGVSFQNNDAYGSSGGTLSIRGFDSTRVSLTFDGIQLNDSGNYAVFSNQMLDPELIEQVNVNLGSTDVDSPTASATGGTVNLRSLTPTEKPGLRLSGSLGDFDFRRLFGVVNTGAFGPFGTRAWLSASTTKNDNPFNNYGRVNKQQYNAKVWQPIGTNGDFVALAGHYNENRNNFFGSLPLRQDLTRIIGGAEVPRIVGPNPQNRFPITRGERFYDIAFPCRVAVGRPGQADGIAPPAGPDGAADPNRDFASCGTEFDRRFNPSNTGNIRGQSRFTLAEGLVLTVDPSFQYVKANGGGTVTAEEGTRTVNGTAFTGFIGGRPFFGRDINGDGDALDQVTVLSPSQTQTRRYGVIAGLRWDIAPEHTVRFSYTLDHARHRQTGEVGLLDAEGEPLDVFPVNDPEADASGTVLQKRDRLSFAILNQVAAEYRGRFDRLTLNLGVRAPFFVRDLRNFCFTTSSTGFVDCFGQDPVRDAAYAAANPAFQGPQKRRFEYDKLLPNLGATFDITSSVNAFASYSKGISVPSTDNLYNSFFFAPDAKEAKPDPETTDSFDAGLRYSGRGLQAQLAGWFTRYDNRQAQAFDPDLDRSVFRNLGRVGKWGLDASVAYQAIRQLSLYAFASLLRSRIQDNIQIGALPDGIESCEDPDAPVTACALTRGRFESASAKYTFGASAVGTFGPLQAGVTAKRTGPRYIFDTNQPVLAGPVAEPTGEIFGATAPAYWLVNLDARLNLGVLGRALEKTSLQANVYNLFDTLYVGGFLGSLNQAFSGANYGNPPFAQIGAPRTVSASLNVQF